MPQATLYYFIKTGALRVIVIPHYRRPHFVRPKTHLPQFSSSELQILQKKTPTLDSVTISFFCNFFIIDESSQFCLSAADVQSGADPGFPVDGEGVPMSDTALFGKNMCKNESIRSHCWERAVCPSPTGSGFVLRYFDKSETDVLY